MNLAHLQAGRSREMLRNMPSQKFCTDRSESDVSRHISGVASFNHGSVQSAAAGDTLMRKVNTEALVHIGTSLPQYYYINSRR